MLPSLEFITLLLVLNTRCSQESPRPAKVLLLCGFHSAFSERFPRCNKMAKDYNSLHSSLGLHLTSYDHEWCSVNSLISPDPQTPTYFRYCGAEGVRTGEGNSNLHLSGRAHRELYSQCVFRPLPEFLMALSPCYLQSLFSLLFSILFSPPSLLSQVLFYLPYIHTYKTQHTHSCVYKSICPSIHPSLYLERINLAIFFEVVTPVSQNPPKTTKESESVCKPTSLNSSSHLDPLSVRTQQLDWRAKSPVEVGFYHSRDWSEGVSIFQDTWLSDICLGWGGGLGKRG